MIPFCNDFSSTKVSWNTFDPRLIARDLLRTPETFCTIESENKTILFEKVYSKWSFRRAHLVNLNLLNN